MLRTAFLFIFLSLLAISVKAAPCSPSGVSCEFYSCMEQKMSCGQKGYWKQLGLHYCQKFLFRENRFSEDARKWLQASRLCLQQRAKVLAQGATCAKVRTDALDTHVGCYVDTGFCELSGADKNQVLWYLLTALRFPRVWQEFFEVNRLCHAH